MIPLRMTLPFGCSFLHTCQLSDRSEPVFAAVARFPWRGAGCRAAIVAAVAPDTQLLVSLEPKGGSPTGPVLYGGRLGAVNCGRA